MKYLTESDALSVGLVTPNTLVNGDCLEVMKYIPDGNVDAVIADPPYGLTDCSWDSIIPLEPMREQLKRVIKPNGVVVLTSQQSYTTNLISSNYKMFKYCWVWVKNKKTGFPFANKQPLRNTEDIIVFYGKQTLYKPQGLFKRIKKMHRKLSNNESVTQGVNDGSLCNPYISNYTNQVLNFNAESNTKHPTQKPVPLMEYLIKTYTNENENETVLDFTMGSGTTGVACKATNRKFIGIEKEPKYFEIAKNRIEHTPKPLF